MDQNPQPIDVTPNQTVNQNLAGVTGASQIPSGGQRLDIAKPFYQQWYFWTNFGLLLIAATVTVIMLVMIADNQRMQNQISELEQEMEVRTQLLVKYGAELGLKTDQYFRTPDTDNTAKSQNTIKK